MTQLATLLETLTVQLQGCSGGRWRFRVESFRRRYYRRTFSFLSSRAGAMEFLVREVLRALQCLKWHAGRGCTKLNSRTPAQEPIPSGSPHPAAWKPLSSQLMQGSKILPKTSSDGTYS